MENATYRILWGVPNVNPELIQMGTVPKYPSAVLTFKCDCGFQHELEIIDIREKYSFEFPCHVCGMELKGGRK